MSINYELRQLRLARGMTQEQAAQQLGITRQALSSYETGRTRPDVDMLLRLAELYGTDLEGLLYGQEPARRALRQIRRTALILLILLVGLQLLSAVLLWSANTFFPVPEGEITLELQILLAAHRKLMDAWKLVDGLIFAVSLLGGVLLLALLAGAKCRIVLRSKLLYLSILAGSLLLAVLPFAWTDPVFGPVDYFLTPLYVMVRFLIFFMLDLGNCLGTPKVFSITDNEKGGHVKRVLLFIAVHRSRLSSPWSA